MLSEANELNALVVGASRGIGLGFVRALLNDGRVHRVFATYRGETTSGDLKSLQNDFGARLVCLQLDVTVETQIESAFKQIATEVDVLHLAIYCVGVLHDEKLSPEKSLRHVSAESLLYSFHVNSVGAALCAKHLIPLFDRETPSIFAAISAKVGSIEDNRLGGWYGYRASKAALNMLLRTVAIEYSRRCPETIVVSLHPGTTDTDLSKPFQNNMSDGQLSSVEETVELLSGVLAKLTLEDSGEFYSWDGSRLPW
ncbi:MAG: SDR family NAD(P)-dependent oxidoreductase [Candidatus Eremiobacteraeota bacterium]|nr:SDR family NAD(P)-dependent oxidoreductase [Candidatus Eremiobacteraeota bacterium]